MTYPNEILKGIPNSDFIDEYESPTSNLFYFNKRKTLQQRADGFREESICWRDNEEAVEILLNQKKDLTLQFKAGIAVLSKHEIDILKNRPMIKQKLTYERNEVPGNKYHGNLLLKDDVPDRVMKKIAANIALCCFKYTITNYNK